MYSRVSHSSKPVVILRSLPVQRITSCGYQASSRLYKAASMVSGLVAEEFRRAGMREGFFEDTMAFSNAQQALKILCGSMRPL